VLTKPVFDIAYTESLGDYTLLPLTSDVRLGLSVTFGHLSKVLYAPSWPWIKPYFRKDRQSAKRQSNLLATQQQQAARKGKTVIILTAK